MFKLIGLGILAYTGFAAASGKVYAKKGPLLDTIHRDERPGYFWTVIGIYGVLGVVVIALF